MMIPLMAASATNYLEEQNPTTASLIEAWQSALLEALSEIMPDLQPWSETNSETLNAEIDETELASLALLCAYTEAKKPVVKQLKSMWDEDKIYQKAINDSQSKFKQILRSVDCFLPYDFDFNFEFADINQDEMLFGSVYELKNELDALNMRTFSKNSESLNSVELMAKSAYDKLLQLCEFAITQQVILWIN